MFPYLKSQIICLGVPPIQPGDKVASRSPKGRLGDPEGPGLCLPRFARHLGGSPPDIGRLTHHGEAPGVRSSGIEVTLAAAAAAAARAPPRVRASTLFARSARRRRRRPPQRSLNGSLARPRPTRPARSRGTAAFSGSLRSRTALFAPGIGRRARARALPATRTTFGLRALSLFYPLSFPLWRRGTGWRRVTRPSVSHAAIGPASWRK